MADQDVHHSSAPDHPTPDQATPDSSPETAAAGVRPLLFEVAWEVCCQTGGIYTVLRTKAPATARRWGDGYWLVGPYRPAAAAVEFEPEAATGIIGEALGALRERGLVIHCGRWLITGRPQVLLVDLSSLALRADEMKYFFWKDIGIGTPFGDREMGEMVVFGYAVADLLSAVRDRSADRPMLAHFHEYQSAAALPILKHRQVTLPTVFTTHATLVGRSLSAANVDLYAHLLQIDGEAVANEHGIRSRFQLEKAATHCADVFTTVSGITALEAEQFLRRKPDILLPNGLNVERFAAPYRFQELHRENKSLIHEFTMGHFFPSYTFDLTKTLYFFTAGRYEYRNKGFDLYIEALYRLNQRLKTYPNGVTVVAFIIAPANYRSPNVETLNRQAMFNELRETCDAIKDEMGEHLFRTIAFGRMPTTEDLLDEFARVRLKRMMHAWRQGPPPTIVTHDLVDDSGDPILQHLRHRGLINLSEDPVKVIFHPEFITSTSPILGLEYDQFVRGCNMGVFPSYYEPWGYTPMECVIRGIPAITSDYSGFGAYVMSHFPQHNQHGIFIARRRGVSVDKTIDLITDWMYALTRMSTRQRIQLRNEVEAYAEHFDWNRMTRYYRAARRFAIHKHYPSSNVLLSDNDDEVDVAPAPRLTKAPEKKRKHIVGSAPHKA
ncbi:MAG: glycogen/starch synthase [Phycisphaerae bacterium]